MKINAQCHSDDYAHEIDFDCLSWFEQASDEEITDLIQCGYGGDYPADAVTLFYEDTNEEIADMMSACRATQGLRDPVGFECHVDESTTLDWIRANRPHLLPKE